MAQVRGVSWLPHAGGDRVGGTGALRVQSWHRNRIRRNALAPPISYIMTYARLKERFDQHATLGEVQGVLSWDMQTIMPSGGAESRGSQLSTLEVMRHELLTDPKVGDWLDAADGESLAGWDRANLNEMRRAYIHATAVEPKLVEALSQAGTRCFMTWQTARAANDWKTFYPQLDHVVALTKETAAAKGAALGLDPYDAMLDTFEPGARRESINQVFAPLRAQLPALLDEVEEAQRRQGAPIALQGPFDPELQKKVAMRLMRAVGFDFDHGRLDVSHHPFCGGIPQDVRITTRYREDEFLSSMMGVVHETGHAMYERQLPQDWARQPVGNARGMAMHESQSLLVEMQAGRSAEFIRFAAPLLHDTFGGAAEAYTPENLERHYLHVERGLIRVDADEVSYPLHVILRFELEQAIFSGDLAIADLPDAWGEGMQRLLGIRPPDDRDGCMQDVHWTDGAFGYFPSYTLGAIAAQQLFASAKEAEPEIPQQIAAGDFSVLMEWLRTHVHSRGSSATADQILTDATGRSFDADAFLAHLRNRYLGA